MIRQILLIFILASLLLSACAGGQQATQSQGPEAAASPEVSLQPPAETQTPGAARTLSVMTHDSFAVSEDVVRLFEQENQVTVRFIESGDAGTALNKAILSRDNPLADVFYGVDNTLLSRGLEEDIFDPYNSPTLAEIPAAFQLDDQNRALPVDYGDVCLNYDRVYFEENALQPPQSLEDLAKPEFKSLLVVENPASSSPGLAFLLATIGRFGEDGYLEYWESLVANDVRVVNDWETAYYGEFSAHDGERPIVVSYNSSPPVEIVFSDPPIQEPITAAVTANDSCFRQIEFVGILKGTQNRGLAEKWIDFMLSTQFQEDLPLQMFVFPVNPQAELPQVFTDIVEIPEKTAQVGPEEITANRETWIQAWNETVLR